MVKAKPKEKGDPLAKKIKSLTDKGMPPKMAKVVAEKQMKKAEAPKGKTVMMEKEKAKPIQSKKPKNVKGGPVLFKAKAKKPKKAC